MATPRRRSPRERRLNSDLRALQELVQESNIVQYEARGNPPEVYRIFFHGKGLWKPAESNDVLVRDTHEVTITLTSAYPRMIPELAWQSPIFHPNISASGVVCLGGYGTHWVPSLMIDELCHMLWDMIRYKNFDIESPYNREAAVWTKQQSIYTFPVDPRPLRNQIKAKETAEPPVHPPATNPLGLPNSANSDSVPPAHLQPEVVQPEVQFIDPVDPPAVTEENGDNDIMFIE